MAIDGYCVRGVSYLQKLFEIMLLDLIQKIVLFMLFQVRFRLIVLDCSNIFILFLFQDQSHYYNNILDVKDFCVSRASNPQKLFENLFMLLEPL